MNGGISVWGVESSLFVAKQDGGEKERRAGFYDSTILKTLSDDPAFHIL
jgi:hypothetical protein